MGSIEASRNQCNTSLSVSSIKTQNFAFVSLSSAKTQSFAFVLLSSTKTPKSFAFVCLISKVNLSGFSESQACSQSSPCI